MNKRSLGMLFSLVFVDMVGFGFLITILPDYVKLLGGILTVVILILPQTSKPTLSKI